jgi:hypothetical protein
MYFETLDEDDCVITKSSMKYFEELIQFRKDNENIWNEWCTKRK